MNLNHITVYAHNLINPHDSFNQDLTLEDFVKSFYYDFKNAKRVVYINPRGEEVILKDYESS